MDITIGIIGLNHKTAPVEIRERLSARHRENEALQGLMQLSEVREVLFLSTCNRAETLFVTKNPEMAVCQIKEFWSSFSRLPLKDFERNLYTYLGPEAVRHLFRVAASLDSMVIGEPQILGQIKGAYRLAVKNRTVGPVLNRLLHKTFSVAKRIRTETKLAHHAVSVSYAAVEMAKRIFGHLDNKRIMLIGAGEMAELAVQHLLNNGVTEIIVANRTLERGMELARRFNGRAISFEEKEEYLKDVDIVISSTGAPHFVITYEQVKPLMKLRKHRPLFFIDIAVPRDIDPQINNLDNVYVYDIDDLKVVVEENRLKREKEARKAERIVGEELIKFNQWLETLDVVPTIIALKRKLEEIRYKELNKTLSHLNHLSDKDKEAIMVMTEAMIKKILHGPITFLKQRENRDKVDLYLDMTRRLFNLDPQEGQSDYHSKSKLSPNIKH